MKKDECRTVEFVGGPFDGHIESFPAKPDALPEDLIWLVSENVFRILDGLNERPKRPISSVAIYERQRRGCNWLYVFVGSISPRRLSTLCAPDNSPFA